jgi:hypothetical protein
MVLWSDGESVDSSDDGHPSNGHGVIRYYRVNVMVLDSYAYGVMK